MSYRANYAPVNVSAHLGPEEEALDVPWADYVGNETPAFEFTVPTDRPSDAYVGVQAFRVGRYGHELQINGESLGVSSEHSEDEARQEAERTDGGFDLPPGEGWQYWEDAITDAELTQGTNALRFVRDENTDDSFAVNNVTVHWREPVD